MSKKVIENLNNAIASMQVAMNEEIDKMVLADMGGDNLSADMAARYWLMQFLEPLSRKELKSVVDGFLIQLLNDEQSKKLVKFLLVRFPQYYKEEVDQAAQPCPHEAEDDRAEFTKRTTIKVPE